MRKLLGGTTAALLALTIAATPAFAANAGAKPGTDTIVQIVLALDGEFDVLQPAQRQQPYRGRRDRLH